MGPLAVSRRSLRSGGSIDTPPRDARSGPARSGAMGLGPRGGLAPTHPRLEALLTIGRLPAGPPTRGRGCRSCAGAAEGLALLSLREALSLPRGCRPSPWAARRAPPKDAPARATEQGVPRWGPSLSPAARCARAGASTPHRGTPARDPHAPARWASAPGAVRPPPSHAAEALLTVGRLPAGPPTRGRGCRSCAGAAGGPSLCSLREAFSLPRGRRPMGLGPRGGPAPTLPCCGSPADRWSPSGRTSNSGAPGPASGHPRDRQTKGLAQRERKGIREGRGRARPEDGLGSRQREPKFPMWKDWLPD